jgi:hypothetical protein
MCSDRLVFSTSKKIARRATGKGRSSSGWIARVAKSRSGSAAMISGIDAPSSTGRLGSGTGSIGSTMISGGRNAGRDDLARLTGPRERLRLVERWVDFLVRVFFTGFLRLSQSARGHIDSLIGVGDSTSSREVLARACNN